MSREISVLCVTWCWLRGKDVLSCFGVLCSEWGLLCDHHLLPDARTFLLLFLHYACEIGTLAESVRKYCHSILCVAILDSVSFNRVENFP